MTPTNAEALRLAAELEYADPWESSVERSAAAMLRRLSAVEAERDALRAALQAHKASAWREGFESGRLYGVESERFDSMQSRPDEYPESPANPYEPATPAQQ